MRLTKHTDYGLRLLVQLALQPEKTVTVGEVARSYDISRHHLNKVARALVHASMLKATRGRGGGLVLAKKPEEIVVGEVVRVLEPDLAFTQCLGDHGTCVLAGLCGVRDVVADARSAFLRVLDGVTIADVGGDPAAIAHALGVDLPREEAAQGVR